MGAVLLGGGGAAARSRASEGKRSIVETLRATVPTRNRTPATPGAFVAMGLRCRKPAMGRFMVCVAPIQQGYQHVHIQ